MASLLDNLGHLDAGQKNAAAALIDLFTQYGLGTLGPVIASYVRTGYSADTISLLLQETPQYKQRFAANDARRSKGLPVLAPAEYLAVEKSYRQIMSNAGLPVGFYDQPEDFRSFLENDLAPQEIQTRVQDAAEFVNQASPEAKAAFSQWYTTGDMVAYALDPKRATSAIDRAFQASQAGGYAASQGLSVSQQRAEQVASLGLSKETVRQGFGVVAQEIGNASKLAQIEGSDLTTEDLISETFDQNAGAAEKRRKLASAERGRFGGSSAATAGTVGSTSRGAV